MAHHSPTEGECRRPEPFQGAVAQLGERRLCKAEVGGSSPPGSTRTSGTDDVAAHLFRQPPSNSGLMAVGGAGALMWMVIHLPHLHNGISRE
jgi:hypothetical protein